MEQTTRSVITRSDGVIAPHVRRRHPVSFVAIFALVFIIAGLGLFALLVPRWPGAAGVSSGAVFTLSAKIVAWVLSGGSLWPNQAPEALAGMAASPVALALKAKASLSALTALGLAWLCARDALTPRDDYEHIRGARLYQGKEAVAALRSDLRKGGEDFIYPHLKVARSEWANGMLCLGSPGSGKSAVLLPYVVKAMDRDDMFMSLDVKREQIQMLGSKAYYLAPWLRGKHSLVLDIGRDITTNEQAQAFADNLIRVDPANGHGKVWQAAANSVFCALVKKLVKDRPLAWGWRDLADILEMDIAQWLEIVREVSPSQALILDGSENTSKSVAFSVAVELRNIGAIANMFREVEKFGGTKFSVREWMTDPNYAIRQVVLCHIKEQSAASETLIPFVLDYCGAMISGLPNSNSPRWFFLDELAQVGLVRSLKEFYEVGRSRGITLVLALQDFAQLEKTYGKDAEILYSAAGLKLICRTSQSRAQERIAQSLGTRDISYRSLSTSSSAQGSSQSAAIQEKTVPLVLPSQLGSDLGPQGKVPDGKGGFKPKSIRALFAPANANAYILDWPIVDLPKRMDEPKPLPSQHKLASWARQQFAFKDKPLSRRIRDARLIIKEQRHKYADSELAALLFSDGLITKGEYQSCIKSKDGLAQFIDTLATREQVESVDLSVEDAEPLALGLGVESESQAQKDELRLQKFHELASPNRVGD